MMEWKGRRNGERKVIGNRDDARIKRGAALMGGMKKENEKESKGAAWFGDLRDEL